MQGLKKKVFNFDLKTVRVGLCHISKRCLCVTNRAAEVVHIKIKLKNIKWVKNGSHLQARITGMTISLHYITYLTELTFALSPLSIWVRTSFLS